MKTLRKNSKYDENEYVAFLALKSNFGYAQLVDNTHVYVGNSTMLVDSNKEEADIRVIANNESFYYKKEFTSNRY